MKHPQIFGIRNVNDSTSFEYLSGKKLQTELTPLETRFLVYKDRKYETARIRPTR